jgi:flagellar biosynthesis component FlhA
VYKAQDIDLFLIVSAVLITVGSLPAIPAIAGGAGGAVLASHAIQAAGAVAVGLGNWLKFAQESTQQQHQQQSQSSAGQASIEECKEK